MNGLHQIFIPLCTLAAGCFIYALIRSLGSQLRLRRLQASIRRQQPSSCFITSCIAAPHLPQAWAASYFSSGFGYLPGRFAVWQLYWAY